MIPSTGDAEGYADAIDRRRQRIASALVEFATAIAREGGDLRAIDVDDNTLRTVASGVKRDVLNGGIVTPIQFYGPTGPIIVRRAK